MSRKVRRKIKRRENGNVDYQEIEELLVLDVREVDDWTMLPDDIVMRLFSRLNHRDRASLASTCKTWKRLGEFQCLWQELDLRPYKFDTRAADSLAHRCQNLQKLSFRGAESADVVINLRARNLCEISGDHCSKISDTTLTVIAARHEKLESLEFGPDYCEKITSDGIKAVAICCPRLRRLRLSGIREVGGEAINALARHCPNLVDIGFIDCESIDEIALANVSSVRYLSVSGARKINWATAIPYWSKLPNLIGLDVSLTDIVATVVSSLFSSSQSLKVLCAFSCPCLDDDDATSSVSNNNHKGKQLLALFTDVLKGVASLFADDTKQEEEEEGEEEEENRRRDVFMEWRNSNVKDKKLDEFMNWVEWILCHSLLRVVESGEPGLDDFWLNQGVCLLLSLMQSSQVEVQERAVCVLGYFASIEDNHCSINEGRAERVLQYGGIPLLLNLAKSWREGLQSEAAKTIGNLSVSTKVAEAVAEEGGIDVLTNSIKSVNRLAAENAASLFLIAAAAALANLAVVEKCSMEIVAVGGVHALLTLVRTCKDEAVQQQAVRALGNLTSHDCHKPTVGEEAGALETLVQLMQSPHYGVRESATGTFWNLCDNERNRKAILEADGGADALWSILMLLQSNPGHFRPINLKILMGFRELSFCL